MFAAELLIKAERILQLAGDFAEEWRSELEVFLGDARRDHIDSVVANKNNIAHGRDVGVTLARARELFKSVSEVIAFVTQQCR